MTVDAPLMANYSGKADGWPNQFVRLVGRQSIISQLYKVNVCLSVLFSGCFKRAWVGSSQFIGGL